MNAREAKEKFWRLAEDKKSAAMDVNLKTGEFAVLCTKSVHGVEGNGYAPEPWTDDWVRLAVSYSGSVQQH